MAIMMFGSSRKSASTSVTKSESIPRRKQSLWLSLAEEALPGVAQCMYVVALLVLMYFDDFYLCPLPRLLHILFAFLLQNRSCHMLLQLER